MINVAVLGKHGSGKTSFLLQALAPGKIGKIEEISGTGHYLFQNDEDKRIYSKKLKELQKGSIIEPTNGANETAMVFCNENEETEEITLWELGGINLDRKSANFEEQLYNCFSQMLGGKSGVNFDGYIFFEDAQEFGIIEGIAYASFAKRFSEYLALSERIGKPILMVCSKRKSQSLEQGLFARFQDNFKLDVGAHYAFFDFEWREKEAAINSRYILSKFLGIVAKNAYVGTLGKSIDTYSNNLKAHTTLYEGTSEHE